MNLAKLLLLTLSITLLGCKNRNISVTELSIDLPAHWSVRASKTNTVSEAPWWAQFNEVKLTALVEEALKNNSQAVYGSRVLQKDKFSNIQNFSHKIRIWGNIFLTFISNKINKQNLTDAHTCYKMFESNLFKSINLKQNDFAFCPEITTKVSLLGISIKEVPINYNGRTYIEGKKIKATDGIKAILALIKYRYFDK